MIVTGPGSDQERSLRQRAPRSIVGPRGSLKLGQEGVRPKGEQLPPFRAAERAAQSPLRVSETGEPKGGTGPAALFCFPSL